MPYLLGALVTDTESHLAGTSRREYNLLDKAVAAGTTDSTSTITLSYDLGGCVAGAELALENESAYVLDVNPSSKTALVLRAQNNTTAPEHAAATKVEIDPPWTRATIMAELRNELRSWGPQVFRVGSVQTSLVTDVLSYDLGIIADAFRVLSVKRSPVPFIGDSTASPWQAVSPGTDGVWDEVPFVVDWAANTGSFPSGASLTLRSLTRSYPGTLQVTYAGPFNVDSNWSDDTDLLDDVGLDTSDLDIAAYGVAWRLLSFRTTRRLETSVRGQSRDASDVPALALLQAAEQFKTMRDNRLLDAQYRLLQKYPLAIGVS